jgi:hypothetical protein
MYAGFDAAHNRGGDAAVGSPQVLNEILIRVAQSDGKRAFDSGNNNPHEPSTSALVSLQSMRARENPQSRRPQLPDCYRAGTNRWTGGGRQLNYQAIPRTGCGDRLQPCRLSLPVRKSRNLLQWPMQYNKFCCMTQRVNKQFLSQCPTELCLPARFAGKNFVSLSPFRAKAVYPKFTCLRARRAER